MRVVLDANVLISAVIQAGPSYRIVSRWLDDASLDVVICPALIAEVEEVLRQPRLQKRIEPELADLYLATIRRIAHLVDDPVSIAAVTRDPNDDYLVALARQHDADICNCPVGTIRSRVARARAQLATALTASERTA